MERAAPDEGAHETFTMPPAGTPPGIGAKTANNPLRVQFVAPTVVPPEFSNVTTHVP